MARQHLPAAKKVIFVTLFLFQKRNLKVSPAKGKQKRKDL
ncbi:hypothetical protein SAMN03084138_03447 [Enterovibrio norvegicus DSM 15893]|uniref:Uncharacterized protein n=1 Tax=Enterovibrio norvegicus DSM 15893 TaxID=1121869 RepID=A0A1I5U4V5_9GAMM|nr:hypothetical protein SAMN03084138_03447 [Enterovibrio norvegicus DSM 15893]